MDFTYVVTVKCDNDDPDLKRNFHMYVRDAVAGMTDALGAVSGLHRVTIDVRDTDGRFLTGADFIPSEVTS